METLVNDEIKNKVIELQSEWINFYDQSKKKILADATQNLISKFNAERDTFRMHLLNEMKVKLETEREEYDYQLNKRLQEELEKFEFNHLNNISFVKKRQWCKVCFKEAIYACCWNTSYCSIECQKRHWPTHLKTCRRNLE